MKGMINESKSRFQKHVLQKVTDTFEKCGNILHVIKKSKMVQQSNIGIAISFSFKKNSFVE